MQTNSVRFSSPHFITGTESSFIQEKTKAVSWGVAIKEYLVLRYSFFRMVGYPQEGRYAKKTTNKQN